MKDQIGLGDAGIKAEIDQVLEMEREFLFDDPVFQVMVGVDEDTAEETSECCRPGMHGRLEACRDHCRGGDMMAGFHGMIIYLNMDDLKGF